MAMPANMQVQRGRGGLLVIKGNASSRCGISMKGIDIVVHGNIGHMSAFMAQSGNMVVLGNAGEALGDSLYEARLFVRGSVKSSARTALKKKCALSISPFWKTCCGGARLMQRPSPNSSAAMARPASSTPSTSTTRRIIENKHDGFPRTPPRYSATFTPAVNAEIRRAAATGIYDIRGGGTKRHLPHFDDLLFLGASISRYPLEGYREKCATDVWLGHPPCQETHSS